ncbi:protein dissatisfaction-like [Hyalella azteca]|uniref:Protein dissatisfaction-like n=1 Tax=Hyalella azteca TaxID=294128 RepID=A0A8B7PLU1_HYAAZ|nr:protein dissatisfaction-like [Hyalella azteca]
MNEMSESAFHDNKPTLEDGIDDLSSSAASIISKLSSSTIVFNHGSNTNQASPNNNNDSNRHSLSSSSSSNPYDGSNIIFNGNLFSRAAIGATAFHFPMSSMPTILPFAPTWEIFQETTARLLFMMVRWIRSLAPFQTLSRQDQCTLVEASWKELFLVHLAQWYLPVDLAPLLTSPAASLRVPQDVRTASEVATIQDVLRRFRHLSPDTTECGCLKAVLLFKPEAGDLVDLHPVEMLQDQAQCILSDYIRSRLPRQPTRFGRLLLLLPGLKTVRASTVEALFFRDTVGDTPIHRLVLDMYTMDKSD